MRLALTDFKMRYQGSVLGFVWTLLKPLLQFLVLYMVFSVFIRLNVPNYQLYLLLGIMIWNYFSEGTNSGLYALLNKSNIIKKVYFPRIVVVFASSVHTLITLSLNLLIFLAFFLLSGKPIHLTALLLLVDLAVLYFLVLGISLCLSVIFLKFRDINQIWEVFLNAAFYLSPIIYPLEFIPAKYRFFLFLNPMTGLIQYARLTVLEGKIPNFSGVIYVVGSTIVILILGLFLFTRFSHKAAEEL